MVNDVEEIELKLADQRGVITEAEPKPVQRKTGRAALDARRKSLVGNAASGELRGMHLADQIHGGPFFVGRITENCDLCGKGWNFGW